MKHFKLIALISAFVLISAVAWAGNTPEYDVVGRDTGDTQNFPLPDEKPEPAKAINF